ncbi:MAG: LysR family transcriptional regulator [Ruminococcus sp.]|nr:LysR family transcriptional regulator [Ruminococcus sp.]
MKIQQLEYVIAIAQEGSITRAAKQLFQAQPNISIALKELENELGIQIFNRTPNGMVLTPEGEEFLGRATSIVNDIHSLERDYLNRNSSEISMNIGISRSSYITAAIGTFISKHEGKFEKMEINLTESDTNRVMNETCIGKYDIGVLRIPENYLDMTEKLIASKNLICKVLLEYRFAIALHRSHPLAKFDDIPYEELRNYPEIYNGINEPDMLRRASVNANYEDISPNKRINVLDRGSQVSIMATVKDAYMWVPPIKNPFMETAGIIIKKCSYAQQINKDIIVYRRSSESNPLVMDCVNTLIAFGDKIKSEIIK